MELLLTGTSTTDWTALTSALSNTFSGSEILSLIGTVAAAGGGFVLLWFGGRKIINGVISAFKNGKLKV